MQSSRALWALSRFVAVVAVRPKLLRTNRRLFLTAAAASLWTGCGGKPPYSPTRPRVVSLSPSTTEAVFAVGAGAFLVGRTRFCDYPKEVEWVAVVGGYSDPNVEMIMGLAPSLVVGAQGPAGPSLEQTLKAQGVATFFPRTESINEIRQMISGMGTRLNHLAEATLTSSAIRAEQATVEDKTRDLKAPRTVMLFDSAPIVAAGPGGFPDELMRLAHADNLIKEGGAYPTIGLERLLTLDPEVILDGAGSAMEGATLLASRRDAPGWKTLSAIKSGRVFPLSSMVLRPGPRIGKGLIELARTIHGSAFHLK